MGCYEPKYPYEKRDDQAANVPWNLAVRYCNKLSRKEKLRPCYSFKNKTVTCDFNANGYHLPNEAEFNYATPFYSHRISQKLDFIPTFVPPNMRKIPEDPRGFQCLRSFCDKTWMWDIFDPEYHKLSNWDPAGADSGKLRVSRLYPKPNFPTNRAYKPYRYGTEVAIKAQLFLTRSWIFETDVRQNNQMNRIPQWDR